MTSDLNKDLYSLHGSDLLCSSSPDVVMRQRHVHVLTHSQVLWVKQLTLWRLQVQSEPVQSQQPSLLPLSRRLVAPQHLPASLCGCQRQTLLCLQEEAEILRVQALPVFGQLDQEEVDVRTGAELTEGFLKLLPGHMGSQLLFTALDLFETETHLRK